VIQCWCGYLAGAKRKWSAYCPDDTTATHHLLLQ